MEQQNNWVAGQQDQANVSGVGGIQSTGGNSDYFTATGGYNFQGAAITRAADAGDGTGAVFVAPVVDAVGTGAIARATGAGAGAGAGGSDPAVMDIVGTGAIAWAVSDGAAAGGTVTAAVDAVWNDGTVGAASAVAYGTSVAAVDVVGTGGAASGGVVAGTGAFHDPYYLSAGTERGRKRYTRQQIDALEAYFKDHPRPREWKRSEIARSFGLEPVDVQLWFQNKRNQVKIQKQREENYAGYSSQSMGRSYILMENVRLREENKKLKSEIGTSIAGHSVQSLPLTFQDQPNLAITFQDPQNLPIQPIQNSQQNLSISSQIPQNLPIYSQNQQNLSMISQNPQNLNSTNNEPTPARFRKSIINNLVVSAAEELKVMAFSAEPLWIPSRADGATSMLDEMEYLTSIPSLFEPTRLGYTREASRHISTVLLNPRQLLDILMNVNKWSFMFSPIVLRASTLEKLNVGVDYDAALHVMTAEYYIATPPVPNRKTYFARYCTKHDEGVWVVVDVSLDNILHTPEIMTCQKGPSGCVIQELHDGTSKITWIEHVYVDYSGVSTMYQPLLLSGLGFGAKRWVSTLERQWQRLVTEISSDISATQELHNLLTSSPAGRTGILKLAERMVSNFILGIAGLNTGRWIEVHGEFGGDVRILSTRAMDHPSLPNATVLSVSTSFVLPLAPKTVFDFLRDHKSRKEGAIFANGIDYEPVCCISSGEHSSNCVSIYKVPMTTSPVHILLQESWSDPVASHIVFTSTAIDSIDVILNGNNMNSLAILPSGFTILPDGPSFLTQGSSGTLLTASFQVLTNQTLVDGINCEDLFTAVRYLKCSCQNIKHALGVVDADI